MKTLLFVHFHYHRPTSALHTAKKTDSLHYPNCKQSKASYTIAVRAYLPNSTLRSIVYKLTTSQATTKRVNKYQLKSKYILSYSK